MFVVHKLTSKLEAAAAAVLLQRSRSLEEVLDDDDDEPPPPLPAISSESHGTDVSTNTASTPKKIKKAQKITSHQWNLAKLMGLNEGKIPAKLNFKTSKTFNVAELSDNIAPCKDESQGSIEPEPIGDILKSIPAVPKVKIILRVPKRPLTSHGVDTECPAPAKKRCRIILKVTKK